MGSKLSLAALTCILAAGNSAVPAYGQSLGNILGKTVERVTRDEARRKTEEETRRAVRCVLGDANCVEGAQDGGNTRAGPGPAATGSAAVPVAASNFVLTPYPGSVPITSSPRNNRVDAYTDYERITLSSSSPTRNHRETERLEGRLTVMELRNPAGRSIFEIERNYLDALRAKGFAVEFSCSGSQECGAPAAGRTWGQINGMAMGPSREVRYFTGSAMGDAGRVYVSVALNPRAHFVHILETTEMDAGLVSATGIAAGLERDGRVELSGVFFDTGRASLRPESESALAEVAELLQAQSALRLDVVGHTDSSGDFDANMSLSKARAEAVRAALVGRYGVDASRLLAIGRGSTKPVADNGSEDGRARNRRVELVRQ